MDCAPITSRKHAISSALAVHVIILSALAGWVLAQPSRSADLEREFASPPDSARMWTWWFWLGDRVDEAGITADLEALKAQGISGVTVYSLSGPGVTGRGPDYMSPAWRALFRHALKEAERLGLGVSTMLSSGWNLGGPWIGPEQACKRHVHSELTLSGPRHFKGRLPQPPADPRFYRDVAIQAFPVAGPVPAITASSSHARYPALNAGDGDGATFWVSDGEKQGEGPREDEPEWLQVDLGAGREVRRVTIVPRPGYGPRDAELQVSADGAAFTAVKALAMDREEAAEMDLPGGPVRFLRFFITSTWSPQSENVQVCEFTVDGRSLRRGLPRSLLAFKTVSDSFGDGLRTPIKEICDATLKPFPPEEPGTAVDPARVIDLGARCSPAGFLDWDVPEGHWMVVRTGCTLTGAMTSCSSPTGAGFEADPFDASAMEFQFASIVKPLVEDAGPLVGKVFRSVQIDSWEIGLPNWSMGLIDDFKKFRGYDPRPYLPVLSGTVIGSAEISDRFLHDFRRTLADCVAENYFGRLSRLAESAGLVQQSEAGGVCYPKVMALDFLANLGRCAIPMGEFWQEGSWVEAGQNKNGKQTASAAHLYGKTIAAAEAFTSFLHWVDSPASLKPTADRAFCEGLNWFFIFSSATHSEDGVPGTEYFAGTYFNRKITWWNQARCFSDYVARCSHLLQQGLFAADVLFYGGDNCPNAVSPKHVDPSLGPGYDYDVCNGEIILTRLAVKDGHIVLPDGMSYRVLVLPEQTTVPVRVLAKLQELVAAGMTLIGPKPEKAAGLEDHPRCDERVKVLADALWGDCDGHAVKEHSFGKGRVVWGSTVREVLARSGVKPDFTHAGGSPDAFLDWIHRSAEGVEIYFIANRKDRAEKAACTFRVGGRQPELWDPLSGAVRDLEAFTQADGLTSVPLEFPPNGSWFVVFRRSIGKDVSGTAEENFPAPALAGEVTGPWTVRFDVKWGGPESATFDRLVSWARRPEDGIRFYSGTATYAGKFDLPAGGRPEGKRWFLDLGDVRDLAEVRLNGKHLGIVWTPPFRVEITGIVKPAGNELEVAVTNPWPNRLIGDAALPAEKRLTRTNIATYTKDSPLLDSGLLGPVTLQAAP